MGIVRSSSSKGEIIEVLGAMEGLADGRRDTALVLTVDVEDDIAEGVLPDLVSQLGRETKKGGNVGVLVSTGRVSRYINPQTLLVVLST